MIKFNLNQYEKKLAIALPNGETVINLPTGNDMGQGVQLTDNTGQPMENNGQPMDGNNAKIPLRDIIGDILYESAVGSGDEEAIRSLAKLAATADIPPEFASNDGLVTSVMALSRRADEDPRKVSVNPSTGEKEQSLIELAESIAQMAGEEWSPELLINEAKARHQDSEGATGVPAVATGAPAVAPGVATAAKKTPVPSTTDEEFKEKAKEDPTKKRKKGNPFKVLLGLARKMSDHGMSRQEIVRKILRQEKNKWKAETIEKAVSIVKNIGRKEEKKRSEEKMDKKSSSFNLAKYAQAKDTSKPMKIDGFKNRKSIYDIDRDIKLMSTMELISRLAYLTGSKDFEAGLYNENNPGNKTIEASKLQKDFNMVKAELTRRNYNKEYLDLLTKAVQGKASAVKTSEV
jgi:hypothetical protein